MRTKEQALELIQKAYEEIGKEILTEGGEVDGIEIKSIGEGRVNSSYEVVLEIEGEFWAFDGSYDSWEGTNFDNWEEDIHKVKRKEKMVVYYE